MPRPDVTGFITSQPIALRISSPIQRPSAQPLSILFCDFEPHSGHVSTTFADHMMSMAAERGLTVEWILDTHPHADHFSAAAYSESKTRRADSNRRKSHRGAEAMAGDLQLTALHHGLPGPAAQGWRKLQDRIARCEGHAQSRPHAGVRSPMSSAMLLSFTTRCFSQISAPLGLIFQAAMQTLFTILHRAHPRPLPDDTRLFTGHDYRPGGRPAQWEASGRAAKAECAFAEGTRPREFRRNARSPRQDPAPSRSHARRAAGQSSWGTLAGSGKQWPQLSEDLRSGRFSRVISKSGPRTASCVRVWDWQRILPAARPRRSGHRP